LPAKCRRSSWSWVTQGQQLAAPAKLSATRISPELTLGGEREIDTMMAFFLTMPIRMMPSFP
jgi:hypothetical protein